jgi:hypothetical protein
MVRPVKPRGPLTYTRESGVPLAIPIIWLSVALVVVLIAAVLWK